MKVTEAQELWSPSATYLNAASGSRARIQAAVRGGRLRTSWHVYNTVADVERALDVLSG